MNKRIIVTCGPGTDTPIVQLTLHEFSPLKMAMYEAAQSYMDQCPVPVVRASYWYYRGRYCFGAQQFDEGFRWLIRAQRAFEQVGYDHIPEASEYLYGLGDSVSSWKKLTTNWLT